MEYKEAIAILLRMIEKYSLEREEKDAVRLAIGTLDCGSLGKNRVGKMIKNRKDKIKKDKEG